MGTYRVPDHVNHRVLDHYPGETFDADIPAGQEARLVARGQLEVVGGLSKLPREQLDTLAREKGVDPDAHPNKPALIDAINAADTPTPQEG